MTIRLHPPRSGARPVDSLPKRKREQHPIHAHTHAPEQSRSRHQGPQHSIDILTATGGRAMPGQASHTRHKLSDGESITTPKNRATMHARRQARNTAGRGTCPHSNFFPEEDSLLRAGGECRRGTAHRAPKVTHTSIHQRRTVADSTTAACRAAEKVHLARRRRHDGITTARILPSSMRLLALRQWRTDAPPHGMPRASTGRRENRPM
ncbi:hypothetical protein TCDM_10988 [Trypanosoma cruzi Dm28c]|uniref:Uncharacterized protein n=1 Tax=Trypanosoma cruzi Dm28c TaxID=1416333 RepID=V5BAK1_TRYCR|nr:hypothetical protein TCDM_10988 [Trypanosoma cruzi Dm28c]